MIEKWHNKLEYCKSLKIEDAKLEELKDLRDVKIDTSLPVIARILSFMIQIENPYLFKVGDTIVKVGFSKTEQTLQKQFECFFTKKY